MSINSLLRWFLTLLIIVIACVFCYIRYNAYFRNPWTRDGMVQAEVVQVAARVSGEVKTVHVRDNQFVKVGDPLFDLDDRPSRVALSQAEANVRQKQAVAKAARDRAGRDARLQQNAPGAISPEAFQQAEDQLLSAEADVAVAQASLESGLHARYGSSERVHHQSDGAAGDHVDGLSPFGCSDQCGQFPCGRLFPRDADPGFPPRRQGADHAHDLFRYAASVESIGWGIARENGSTGEQLLPSVSPTFEWIRLAQRIPVRLHFDALPKGIELRAGTTASVLVRVHPEDTAASIPPLPTIGQ